MTTRSLLVVIALLACSCGNHTGNAIVVLNGNGTEVQPIIVSADDPQNPSAVQTIQIRPRILSLAKPVSTIEENSPSPSAVDTVPQPVGLLPPPLLIKMGPDFTHTDDDLVSKPEKPAVVGVRAAQVGVAKNGTTLCVHSFCPTIYCPNSLPAIPSQGICCPRCIFNKKCNTSRCPKYKCAGDIAPANLTAGECCDHCAPVTRKPTHQPVRTQKTQSHKVTGTTKKSRSATKQPKKVEQSSSEENSESSDISDGLSSSSSSSAEEYAQKHSGCNIRPEHKKHHQSCLLNRLICPLGHLRHPHSNRRSCGCKK